MATDRQTNKQTDEQMDRPDAWSRSRCHEQRLNNGYICKVHIAQHFSNQNDNKMIMRTIMILKIWTN